MLLLKICENPTKSESYSTFLFKSNEIYIQQIIE